MNKKYSYLSHKRKSFVETSPSDFSNSIIVGASFYQSAPYTVVFPEGVENCELKNCNVDNCVLPSGFSVSGSTTNKHFKVQNDGENWIVSDKLAPIAPMHADAFDKCCLSKDPIDIPAVKVEEPVTFTNDPDRIMQEKLDVLKENDAELKAIIEEKEAAAALKEIK